MFGPNLARRPMSKAGQRPHRSSPRQRHALSVEALERRTLLTVVFDPVFGAEAQKQDGSDGKMFRPPINIVFWGHSWQGNNPNDPNQWNSDNSPDAVTILTAINQVIQSTYLDVTGQYGADPYNMFINDVRWDNSDPGATFDDGKIDDVVQNQIDDGHFPEPDQQKDNLGNKRTPIYIVVTPSNSVAGDGAAGFNTSGTDFDLPADLDHIPEIWAGVKGTSGDSTVNPDKFSKTVAHEIAEIMTDFGQDGFEVNTPAKWATGGLGGDDQIGDKEGETYSFRMSDSSGNPSINVQPVWSRDAQAWVVTDGTAQTFNLTANWDLSDPKHPTLPAVGTYALTINGDQWLDINDSVRIDTDAKGDIKINLNNEVVNFDANYLSGITLNLKSGVNSVYLGSPLPAGVKLGMNAATPFGGSIVLHGPDSIQTNWNITGADIGTFDFNTSTKYTFTDVESITGGSGIDSFSFLPGGSLSGSIDGAGGTNFLNFGSFTDAIHPDGVTVDADHRTATPIAGTFGNIGNVFGSNATDTVTASGDLWRFIGQHTVSVNGIALSSFENFDGGTGDDVFRFFTGGTAVNIDGGGGADTLDYSQLAGPVTVNFNTSTASQIDGKFSDIEQVIGSKSPFDTIVGPDALWTIDAANAGSVNGLNFSSFENLTGSPDTDTFRFLPGGGISGNLDGGGGTNTLDYSALSTPVTLNLASNTATGIGGTFADIGAFVPGSAGFSVVGPNTPTTWTVTGVNTVNALGFTFTNTPSVTGGSADDTFLFKTGARLDGKIDGGGGNNTLSFAGSDGDVSVDLALHSANRAAGGVYNIQNVAGGNANNLLVGDDNPNALTGGLGRNILIGRGGADLLKGGAGDNLLIGDSTIYDLNVTALNAIAAEWNRKDVSFEKRVSDLLGTGGAGLNGAFTLNKSSILSDISLDILTGSSALDWFFVTNKQDALNGGATPGDHTTIV